MRRIQNKPFFSRLSHAALANLLVACLLTVISFFDVLVSPFGSWEPGQIAPLNHRKPTSYRSPVEELLSIFDKEERYQGFIIRRGETVSEADLHELKRLLPERMHPDPWRIGGVFSFFFLALTFFNLFLRRSHGYLTMRLRATGTIYLVLGVSLLASRLLLMKTTLSIYAMPSMFAAILLTPLVKQSAGLAVHLLSLALHAPMVSFTPGMVIIPLVCGWTAVLLLDRESGPVGTLVAAAAGAAVGGLFLAGLDLFTPQRIDFGWRLEGDLVGLAGGILSCGLVAGTLSYPVTLLWGSAPRSRLRALLDLDHPLLKDLAEKAPGSFQHSLAMANMAEKVADDIGVDAELVRVGAYYHDIGKMHHPNFFIENQHGENPHDQISPEASAEKLRAHVSLGVTIARGGNLPERVLDFIVEHHGRSTMEYFLDKAFRSNGEVADPGKFEYLGRNPTSRETAILMIVDSVEAASRTLQNPDHDAIEGLVRRIVFSKLLHGYLDDSGLTTKNLKQVGISLIKFLQGQFHVRVEYPWQKKVADRPPLRMVSNGYEGAAAYPEFLRVAKPVVWPTTEAQPDLPSPNTQGTMTQAASEQTAPAEPTGEEESG